MPFAFFCARNRFFQIRNRFFHPQLLKWRVVRHGNQQETEMAANNRMKAARVLKNLTQLELAELVGTREIEISRIETGRVMPGEPMKQRIALVLQKPAYELFDA